MLPVWNGFLAVSGKMAAAAGTRFTNFDPDAISIAPNVDSESPYDNHASPYIETCSHCANLTYVHYYTQQCHWLLWRAACHEHSGCRYRRAL